VFSNLTLKLLASYSVQSPLNFTTWSWHCLWRTLTTLSRHMAAK